MLSIIKTIKKPADKTNNPSSKKIFERISKKKTFVAVLAVVFCIWTNISFAAKEITKTANVSSEDSSTTIQGTSVMAQGPEETPDDGEGGNIVGSWTDLNCNSNTDCGIGLTYLNFSFPSSHVGCPSDSSSMSGIVSYSPAGDANYYEMQGGVESTSSNTYSYKNRFYAHNCCKYYVDDIQEGRNTSCHFATELKAASIANTDGSVFINYFETGKEETTDNHYVNYSYTADYSDNVYAAIPVLAGFDAPLKGAAKIKEWKARLYSGTDDFYLSPTSLVYLSSEVYVNGDGEHLKTNDSSLGMTVIALPENLPSEVQSAGGRSPVVLVARVSGSTASCLGIYGGSSTYPYSCNGGNNSPNFTPSGTQISFQIVDLTETQFISKQSTVFIQSSHLEFNDYHDVKKMKMNSGADDSAQIAIEDPVCSSTGCSQTVQFTPSYNFSDDSGHDANSNSYLDIALLILFEYTTESE